jgi:hypothetical protein
MRTKKRPKVGWYAKTNLVGPIDGAKTINSVEMVFFVAFVL